MNQSVEVEVLSEYEFCNVRKIVLLSLVFGCVDTDEIAYRVLLGLRLDIRVETLKNIIWRVRDDSSVVAPRVQPTIEQSALEWQRVRVRSVLDNYYRDGIRRVYPKPTLEQMEIVPWWSEGEEEWR